MSDQELRNLDAQICQHVMGWKRITDLQQLENGQFFFNVAEGAFVNERQNFIKKFSPSTNRADAMTVLEKCAEKVSGAVEIWKFENGDVSVGVSGEQGMIIVVKSLPIAVCLLARKLFEVSEDK